MDFFCVELRVVIEIDGPIHDGQEDADRARQSALELTGLRVLRVSASDVEQDVEGVLERLSEWIRA